MEEGSSENEESGKKSNRRLVRILVIVGIGIPVLVELLTLFNLVNVQLFSNEKEEVQQVETVKEVPTYVEGDTLFTDYATPIVIRSMEIKVNARQWRYELVLMPADTATVTGDKVRIDSLRLESGKLLSSDQSIHRQSPGEGSPGYLMEWELPSGDIPQRIYLSSTQQVAPDSTATIQKEIPLGKIPIRYRKE